MTQKEELASLREGDDTVKCFTLLSWIWLNPASEVSWAVDKEDTCLFLGKKYKGFTLGKNENMN